MADMGSRALVPDGAPAFSFSGVSHQEPREKHKNGPEDTIEESKQPLHQIYQQNASSTSPDQGLTYPQHVRIPASYVYTSSLPSSTSTFYDGSAVGSSVPPSSMGNESLTPLTPQQASQQGFQHSPYQASPSAASTSGVSNKSGTPEGELADVLRELKIDQGGVAPYIANQQQLGEVPAMEEQEPPLPPPQTYPDAPVQIPMEMMPSDQLASEYIDYFFKNIHPYVPVVNREALVEAWRTDRYSIPPLILEGIFASSAYQLGRIQERGRWLALAARHEENFRDMPRLSTIQGLILVMKARETVPKRGYYYRSWITVQLLIRMGKDLGLHTHNQSHIHGQACKFDTNECVLRSRIWHTLFQIELMVGGPQGRFDFSIDLNTVNLQVPTARPGLEYAEWSITRDQTFFVKLIHNVRMTAALYARVKQVNGDCSTDADFVKHNEDYMRLGRQFPQHLQVKYPEDGSPPSLPFHYMANLQAYHLLSLIMHYRPQLEMNGRYDDQSWKDIMARCHDAATKICRLHEAVFQRFGPNGLLCMLRGINFAIYTILSCTLLHLVAITSPDPVLNEKAKDYFSRHMRILEKCASSWPVPQLKIQIDSLRQAFSADLNKPFELRQNFPFGSPDPSSEGASPHSEPTYLHQAQHRRVQSGQSFSAPFGAAPVTPPQTTPVTSQEYTPSICIGAIDGSMPAQQHAQWDPSGVFQHWRTAFNPTQYETPSPSFQNGAQPSVVAPTSIPAYAAPQQQGSHHQNPGYFAGPQSGMSSVGQAAISPTYPPPMAGPQGYLAQGPATTPSGYGGAVQPYVTPSMWQDVVAQSSGWKRRHESDASELTYKRMR
ncbi:MAG: hypothetical protein Q9162_000646 [Coniocarpon cinnabarinum]